VQAFRAFSVLANIKEKSIRFGLPNNSLERAGDSAAEARDSQDVGLWN
jgi:hypothetical protein